jgi:hypothetical protein
MTAIRKLRLLFLADVRAVFAGSPEGKGEE